VGFPQELALVQAFATAIDVDSPARFGRWLTANGYPVEHEPTAAELALATGLRDALRAELEAHHDAGAGDPDARSRLDSYASRVPLRAAFGAGPAGLAGAGEGVAKVLGDVIAQVVLAERAGSWARVKICREDTCQAVFFDQSKNQSKTWCSMGICGNRNKTRSYRSRQRQAES